MIGSLGSLKTLEMDDDGHAGHGRRAARHGAGRPTRTKGGRVDLGGNGR